MHRKCHHQNLRGFFAGLGLGEAEAFLDEVEGAGRDVVSDLLQDLAAEDLGKDWVRRYQGYSVGKKAAKHWWAKAAKVGEEAYAVAHVLPAEGEWPSNHWLRIILKKYPQRLPEIYRTVLRRSAPGAELAGNRGDPSKLVAERDENGTFP